MYYRYAIKKDSTTYYNIQGGEVITQSTPRYFYEGINKFSDLGISEYRNLMMEGFFRNISQKGYQFVGDMMKILRHIAFTNGVQARATLVVERLSDYKSKTYILDYESDVNFAKSSRERNQFVGELMQNGVEELLKSREDSPYTLEVSGDGKVTINILPFKVRGRCRFMSVQAKRELTATGINRTTAEFNMIGYANFKEEIIEILDSPTFRPIDYFDVIATNLLMGGGASDTQIEFGQPCQEWSDLSAGINKTVNSLSQRVDYLIKANVPLYNVNFKGRINVFLKNSHSTSPVDFSLQVYQTILSSGVTTPKLLTPLQVTVQPLTQNTYTFDFDYLFDVDDDSLLYFTVENETPSVTEVEWTYEKDMPFTIDFEHYTSAFTVTGLNWFEVGKRLVNLNTKSMATFTSSLLTQDNTYSEGIDCKARCLALLSSKSIKGIANPDIQISWTNYLKATDVMLCTGTGIERTYGNDGSVSSTKVTLEKKKYYYQEKKSDGVTENLIAELGDPAKEPEQSVTFAEELAYNEVHIGYRETDTDDLQGEEEYNTTLKMQTSYTKEKNVKDLVSPVSASGLAIYRKFIRYATGQDEDNGNDNELFVLQYSPVNTNGVHSALYPAEINASYTITGLTDPARALNIGLTPKRCLLRRLYWEISHFYDSDPFTDVYDLDFLTLDKNKDLVSQLSTTFAVGEKSDLDMSFMIDFVGQSRLFYPYYINSNHEMPDNIRALWQGNRHGVFAVNVEGQRFLGFPDELHEKNRKPKMYDVKLRLTASQNLYNLR